MVAVYNKKLLSWYLVALKLRETIHSRSRESTNSGIPSQQSQEQQKKLQHDSFESLQTAIQVVEEDTDLSDSDWMIRGRNIPIKKRLELARLEDNARPWSKLSIYKVPHYLRDGNDAKAFVPQIVSIGPYHHGKQWLRQMERRKWRSLHHVLHRTGRDVNFYLDEMKKIEKKARSCYEGPISLKENEFVQMLVLDGCFVLELFQGAREGFKQLGYFRNDPVFAMGCSMHSIQRDMIMLENQLPLLVLDRLLGLQSGNPDQKGLVAKLALGFFNPLMPTDEPLTKSDGDELESSLRSTTTFDPLYVQGDLHCLDAFRSSLLLTRLWIKRRSNNHRVADKRRQQLVHCVMELRESGIKFKRRKTGCFWDIRFKNGVMRMPRLLIHDGTKSLFLNLIAFEQSHLDCSNDFTSYVIFMDNLINSPEDVAYLHYCGIIEHWLGSDAEVADLFNRLCREVVFDINNSYLSPLSEDVNRYYNHRWNAWRASLRHNYFSNPWAIISLIAAVVLLLLTFAQTYYTVYGYYRPIS